MATLLKPGDVVSCHIKEARIVSSYSGFDSSEPFQVLASDDEGYYVYIPDHIFINEVFTLDAYRASVLGIQKQFIGVHVAYITASQIAEIKFRLDGLNCSKCGEFYEMAESNQPGGTLICFTCRTYHWW